MKLSAQQKVFIVSAAAHGLLIVLLSPWLTLVRAGTPPVAEVRCDIVAAPELTPEPPTTPSPLPPPPEDLVPPRLTETCPPEEELVDAPLFEPSTETSLQTTFDIPRERSMAIRTGQRPGGEPPSRVTAAPPPVRAVAVLAPTGPPARLNRKALPVRGNRPPRYPARAVERALQGVVLLVVHIDREGQVARVELKRGSGYAILDREAQRAVAAWKFCPALKNGNAIPSRIEVPIRFRIS